MKLSEIIQVCDVVSVLGNPDVEITGLTNDSRRVVPGGLFIAVNGCGNDGRQYLQKAIGGTQNIQLIKMQHAQKKALSRYIA